jgi:hypothetical protein
MLISKHPKAASHTLITYPLHVSNFAYIPSTNILVEISSTRKCLMKERAKIYPMRSSIHEQSQK